MKKNARSTIVFLSAALLSAGAANPYAPPFASADAANNLGRAMDKWGLYAIAAADPTEPGTFVAALYIPGSQLRVVSARHPSADGVAHRLAMHQYREVYLVLQGTPTPQNKFFVHDANADGILSALPDSRDVDVLYEDGVRQTLFNGDMESQHLTPAEYDAKLAAADQRYARLLTLLTAAVHDTREETSGGET